jgi:putative transcriptional regulator
MSESYRIDFSIANSEQIEAALCQQLEKIRLMRNITQAQLAAEAGVSLPTISRLVKGKGVSLDTFIRVMIAFGIQHSLAALLPDPSVRPADRARNQGRERQRARPKKGSGELATWTWGDEKEEDQ